MRGLPWWLSSERICLQCQRCVQEMCVRTLGQEGALEKEMATHSSILVWEIPWTEEPSYSTWGHKRVGHDLVTKQQQQNRWEGCSLEGLRNLPEVSQLGWRGPLSGNSFLVSTSITLKLLRGLPPKPPFYFGVLQYNSSSLGEIGR